MQTRTVRFKVRRGLLEPLEPVPLVEGEEFDVPMSAETKPATIGTLLEILERQPRVDPSLIEELNGCSTVQSRPASSPYTLGVSSAMQEPESHSSASRPFAWV
jgi:predicted DNA-binding antitoxin AbrB/MazE fold protein